MNEEKTTKPTNFIRDIIDEELGSGKHQFIKTRFPPEPNGYLHIGHAKAICTNFGIALDYQGSCNLRFDDTNPEKESQEYVNAIKEDITWLGFKWDELRYASNYFDQLYHYATELIKMGKAYVCHLSAAQVKEYRGTLTEPGKDSPFRNRSIEENLALFEQMKNGEFEEGECTLRAKIDMTSPNIPMRDPAIYRIKKAYHHNTKDKWCIYPMYDFTHCLSDMIEGITHSLCSLEFEDRRPLYNWVLETLNTPCHPRQIEFARLNLTYTMMSKRKLLSLVNQKIVSGWDDPRMPTISGLRRRGFTASSIRSLAERVGLAKRNSLVDYGLLEFCIRDELNATAPRLMAILDPIKVVITNYEGQDEELVCPLMPEDDSQGTRVVTFGKELYIEREDFMEDAPKKFFRLSQGREVRLRYAYYITCNEVIKDDKGQIIELHCTYDPQTKGGNSADGRKVKGTLHWVSAKTAKDCQVRLYDHLFTHERPDSVEDLKQTINVHSFKEITAKVEPHLMTYEPGSRVQFERMAYFYSDHLDSTPGNPIWNRIVTLKDTWAKVSQQS